MIVIPMAGMSSRFAKAGYTVPKYMLQAHGRSLFAHAVGSFAAFVRTTPFLFIARDIQGTRDFIGKEVAALGIDQSTIVILPDPTSGQAETVAMGLSHAGIDQLTPITVFNIDTFRPGFHYPKTFSIEDVDGYLEVFRGDGSNWSYVRPDLASIGRVAETTEKIPVSDLCCTGLYHFRAASLFSEAYEEFVRIGPEEFGLKELYIAPMYNFLINRGLDIRYAEIARDEVIFCGVPDEYNEFLQMSM